MSLLLPVIILQEERKTSSLFVVKKTNDHLRTTSSFVFRGQKAMDIWVQPFVFHCQRTDDRLSTVSKILYFAVKK